MYLGISEESEVKEINPKIEALTKENEVEVK
jgi:hypothetical protein